MSLWRRRGVTAAQDLIPGRTAAPRGLPLVTADSALRHSGVWAAIRLRADLISTMPVDTYRMVGDVQVPLPNAPVLVQPGGPEVDIIEWLYSSQVDLDRCGNAIGLITERTSLGLPLRIDLQPIAECSVRTLPGGEVRYRICGKDYPRSQVWHERQFTVSGLPVGLPPVAYAAWSIGQYQSAAQFAAEWYGNGGTPKASLKNTVRPNVSQEEAETVKAKFKAATQGGDLFVTGREWEYKPIQAEAVGAEWLAAQEYGIADVARFFGVPAELIGGAAGGSSLTYANVTQRNLDFLIMHLGPSVVRRERSLSQLLPRPRFVKLNPSALLRMDDETRAAVIKTRLDSRTLTNSEARALENRPPLTDADLAEIAKIYGPPKVSPAPAAAPVKG